MFNETKNYYSENQTFHDSMCQTALNTDEEDDDFPCNNANTTDSMEEADKFEKSMEMVFEVGLLTSIGILGVLGNCAATYLFAR